MSDAVERERTWLVRHLPELPAGTSIRQGYLALDGSVTVRVRHKGEHRVVTVKGRGTSTRTEIEWPITDEQFAALWDLTQGRRVHKTRYEVPVEGGVAELDVFAGALEGLVLVEVEFDSDHDMETFHAPDWFGPEVTDRPEYTNAALACAGIPADHPDLPERA